VRKAAFDQIVEKYQDLASASVDVDLEFLQQRVAQLVDAPRLLDRIPNLGTTIPSPK
jgi:hypothetical protein